MAEQTSVFLSYRRADTPHVSGRLGDRLAERYKLFMDIDNIRPGMDFTKVVREAINECDVLLALIGPNWLTSFDGVAKRNPDNPRDWVVEEVRAALQRDIAVIPVLVDGARMPDPAEVPPVLEPLTYRQALTLRHESFSADVAKLFRAIDEVTGASTDSAPPPPPDLFKDLEYSRALAAMFNRRWDDAVALLTSVNERFPNNADVQSRLERSERNQRLATVDAQAREAESAGRWRDAVDTLEMLAVADPGYPDVGRRLAAAKREQQIAELRDELRGLFNAGEWAGVIAASQRIAELDPSRADPDGLAAAARERLSALQVEDTYAAGVRHLVAGEFAQAVGAFELVRAQVANFRDTADLLAGARAQLELETWQQRAAAAEASGDWEGAVEFLSLIADRDRRLWNVEARLNAATGRRDALRAQARSAKFSSPESGGQPGGSQSRHPPPNQGPPPPQNQSAPPPRNQGPPPPRNQSAPPPRNQGAPPPRTQGPPPFQHQTPASVHVPVERTPQRAILLAVIGLVLANGALFLAVRQSPWIGLGITILSLAVSALVARAASRKSAPAARTGLRRYVAVGAVVAVAVAIPSTFIIGAAAEASGVPLAAILFFVLPMSQAAVQYAILRRRVGQLAVSLAGVFYFTCMTGIFLTALIAYA